MSSKSTPHPETLRQAAETLLSRRSDQIRYCQDGNDLWNFFKGMEEISAYHSGWTTWSGEEKALLCLFFAEAIEQGDL